MKDVPTLFAVVAINAETGLPSLMGYAETLLEAEEMQRRATRFGWHGDLCEKATNEREFSELVVLEDWMSAMLAEQREDNSHDI